MAKFIKITLRDNSTKWINLSIIEEFSKTTEKGAETYLGLRNGQFFIKESVSEIVRQINNESTNYPDADNSQPVADFITL